MRGKFKNVLEKMGMTTINVMEIKTTEKTVIQSRLQQL